MRLEPVPELSKTYSRMSKLPVDTFYQLPREVQNFLEHVKKELKHPWWVGPRTIHQTVSLMRGGDLMFSINYEHIFDDIVRCLDLVATFVNEKSDV